MATYAEVISSNPTSYSAKRYAKRLPYVILALAIGGLTLILLFFFAPWFSTGEPATLASTSKLYGPTNVSALTVGSSGLNFTQTITKSDGSGSFPVSDSYSFPLILAIPVVGLIQVVLALLLLKDRIPARWLVLAIRLSFAAALLFELIYFFSSYILAFGAIKSAGGQISTFPVYGLWYSLLITLITCIITYILIPDLKWSWTLAVNDKARAFRIDQLRAARPKVV